MLINEHSGYFYSLNLQRYIWTIEFHIIFNRKYTNILLSFSSNCFPFDTFAILPVWNIISVLHLYTGPGSKYLFICNVIYLKCVLFSERSHFRVPALVSIVTKSKVSVRTEVLVLLLSPLSEKAVVQSEVSNKFVVI